jgi:hypothetical protein
MNELLPVVHDTPELSTMPKVFLPRQRLSAIPFAPRTAEKRNRQVSDVSWAVVGLTGYVEGALVADNDARHRGAKLFCQEAHHQLDRRWRASGMRHDVVLRVDGERLHEFPNCEA